MFAHRILVISLVRHLHLLTVVKSTYQLFDDPPEIPPVALIINLIVDFFLLRWRHCRSRGDTNGDHCFWFGCRVKM